MRKQCPIQHHKRCPNQQNGNHCCFMRQPQVQQFVMYMTTVRLKRIMSQTYSMDYNTHDVKSRNNQHGERNDNRTIHIVGHQRFTHSQTDSQKRQYQTDTLRTSISHKNLPTLVRLTKYIIIEERAQRSKHGKSQYRTTPKLNINKHQSEKERSYDTQSRCQSVNTVNKINGIDKKYNYQYRKRHSKIRRHGMNTKQPVEIIQPYT